MRFALAPGAALAGYRLETHETIGSTNALALERAAKGEAGPLWIVSPHQQAGRGRRGRAWATEPGNLAATLLIRPDVPLREAATLGFVAGLSLSDALNAVMPDEKRIAIGLDGGSVAGGGRFALKWPNDVLADGAKLSGILLESVVLASGAYALAIGIGVNVAHHPDDLPYPATSLRALGAKVDAAMLFLALSDAWMENIRLWADGRGLRDIRQKWLARAAGIGAEVAVRVDGAVLRGMFETIDEDCRFVIRLADGNTTSIAAGDVHFGAVASAGASPRAGD
ncbi:biotin--[acetyl-CoA-carboxylase] ligase [Aureimonas endophytica]|uniref:biotin--[biotin carboxyl-carrier protein] ligase n=1 Tax=Aureimonas endophytica TaxID=2027858 RepID=A0A916ZDP5_9HYPH|nr:biotin--[acetyl-CoA-carboxylase] ligase [Aureimonas endophytica]GGD88192.1 biotin--[acetyl-CoA-carboxylase] ligase [Aureimonas endophytica]